MHNSSTIRKTTRKLLASTAPVRPAQPAPPARRAQPTPQAPQAHHGNRPPRASGGGGQRRTGRRSADDGGSDTDGDDGGAAPARQAPPAHHGIDRRALKVAEAGAGAADDLLTTRQLADWLDVSIQWCEIGRHRGYGPHYQRIGPRMIRYRRSDVLAWLDERTHASTREYSASPGRPAKGAASRGKRQPVTP